MLSILHQKIQEIVNIVSISQTSANNFSIEYTDAENVSQQQLDQVNNILNLWPLDQEKFVKLTALDNKWNTDTNNGFSTPYGWKLGLTNNDVTLLTGAFLLAKEASNMGISQNATIIDTNGVSHSIAINDLTLLMLQYGQYRTELSTQYSNTKILIQQASSIEELNNIIIE